MTSAAGGPGVPRAAPRRVLVTGASGLLGRAITAELRAAGSEVVALGRGSGAGPRWDPDAGTLDPAVFTGVDAVVHLAGETIAARFTSEHRRRVRGSRERGTRLLAETLGRLERRPAVLLSASAIGLYGDRGDEVLDEGSLPGAGFLAEVGRAWEGATAPAAAAGIRVVTLRTGLVLAPGGGALAPMLLPARLGLGGPLGSGHQWWSWVSIDDVAGLVHHALLNDAVSGPLNVVAPEPVRQADFARALGRVLHRPAIVPAPAFALRLLLGRGMADELLLASARVLPRRALATGYAFRRPGLEDALRAAIGGGTR